MSSLLVTASARFGGWFQPWVVALLIGGPALLLLAYRAGDLRRWLDNKAWRRRANEDERDR